MANITHRASEDFFANAKITTNTAEVKLRGIKMETGMIVTMDSGEQGFVLFVKELRPIIRYFNGSYDFLDSTSAMKIRKMEMPTTPAAILSKDLYIESKAAHSCAKRLFKTVFPEPRRMTVHEIEKALGYEVEIIGGQTPFI